MPAWCARALLEELAGEGRLRLEDIEVMHLLDTPDGQLPWLTSF